MPGTTKLKKGLHVFTVFNVKNGIGKYTINAGLDNKLMPILINKLNRVSNDKITLVVRSSREHYTDGPFPHAGQVKQMIDNVKKEVRVFYQEPWPAPVPNLIRKDTVVIRFGYDEGCQFDKEVATGKEYKTDRKDGSYPLLITHDSEVDLTVKFI